MTKDDAAKLLAQFVQFQIINEMLEDMYHRDDKVKAINECLTVLITLKF